MDRNVLLGITIALLVVVTLVRCTDETAAPTKDVAAVEKRLQKVAANSKKLANRVNDYVQEDEQEEVSTDDSNKWGLDDTHNNDNNDYQQQQPQEKPYVAPPPPPPHSSGSYGDGKPSHSGLAQVIPAAAQQTLDQIYHRQQNPYGVYQSNNQYQGANSVQQPQTIRQDMLLLLIFARDFDQFNPRNNNSQWQWAASSSTNMTFDNAAFLVHQYQNSYNVNPYGHQQKQLGYGQKKKSNNEDYVDLISIPYSMYYPNNEGYFEGVVETKTAFNINNQQRFLARLKCSCHTINTGNNPYPSTLVYNSNNDPRLGSCVFGLLANVNGTNTVEVYFSITNTGVWAVTSYFETDPFTLGALQFVAKRRVGVRPRYDSLVDAAVEIDRRLNVVNYYLNGYLVWSVPIGLPPPADGITSINLGQGTPMAATVNSVQVYLGTSKCLDEVDPNNPNSKTRLINLAPGSFYYGLNDTYYDAAALKFNQIYGEGATMRLFKLILVRADSVPPPQPLPLPGVYGASAPVYHQSSKNKYENNNNNNDYQDDEYIR